MQNDVNRSVCDAESFNPKIPAAGKFAQLQHDGVASKQKVIYCEFNESHHHKILIERTNPFT